MASVRMTANDLTTRRQLEPLRCAAMSLQFHLSAPHYDPPVFPDVAEAALSAGAAAGTAAAGRTG